MRESVFITKINETYIRIDTESHIHYELFDHFSFFVPGFQFTPKYKSKMWDGKIYLYSKVLQRIYAGLLPFIEDFCKERDYNIEIDIGSLEKFNKEDLEFINTESFFSQGKKLTPRPYQIKTYQQCLIKNRCTIVSAVGSGKSLSIFSLMRKLFDRVKGRILIVVPTTSLCVQMTNDFIDYSNNNETWNVINNCQKIYSGQKIDSNKRVIISTWQSLYKKPKEYFSDVDVIINDETHLVSAKEISSIAKNCVNAKFRYGFTGTLDNEKCNKLVIQGLLGKVIEVSKTSELIEEEILSNLFIYCIILKYSQQDKKEVSGMKYQNEIEFIISHQKRINYINNLISELKGNSLVLFTRIEKQGIPLYKKIKKTCKDKKVFFVSGATKVEDREKIRKYVDSHKNCIIVASVQIFSTGINIKNLKNIVLVSPTKSKIRTLQSIGRVLRKSKEKNIAYLFDIVDDLRYNKKNNFALKHFAERLKLYIEEKFKFKVVEINLDT